VFILDTRPATGAAAIDPEVQRAFRHHAVPTQKPGSRFIEAGLHCSV
jgi:hypothetical protein